MTPMMASTDYVGRMPTWEDPPPEMEWEEPPPKRTKWDLFVEELKKHPGRSAVVKRDVAHSSSSPVSQLRKMGVEVTTRKTAETDEHECWTIWARWPAEREAPDTSKPELTTGKAKD